MKREKSMKGRNRKKLIRLKVEKRVNLFVLNYQNFYTMNATNNAKSPKIRGEGLVFGDVEQITNKNRVDSRQNNFLKAIEILQS